MLSNTPRRDRTRQLVTTVALLGCLVGTAVGTGLLGTAVESTGGGALAASATHVAPAGSAFSIWSVIYLGLVAFTVWQWRPSHAGADPLRSLGYLPAWSMVLNAAWILIAQTGVVWATVVVIVALLAVVALIVVRLTRTAASAPRDGGPVERLVLDGTFGLYLGWLAVATIANVAAALVDGGVDPGPRVSAALGAVVVLLAGAVAVLLARRLGARWAVAAAMAWGLLWVAVGRISGEPYSPLVAGAAVVAALAAVAAPVVLRLSRGGSATRARTRRPQLR